MQKIFGILGVTAITGLAACVPNMEAGADLDEGGFGNPTMNNTMVQTGQMTEAMNLSRKFAAEVPSTVNFAFNSAVLDENARSALREQAAWIAQYPYAKFRVYGHTDKVGSNGYNKSLGLRRAHTVVSYLVSQGISRKRLEAVVSFGETQPLIVTEGRERQNRRTVTEVSGFLKSRPQYMDGKYAQATYEEYITSAARAHEIDAESTTEE